MSIVGASDRIYTMTDAWPKAGDFTVCAWVKIATARPFGCIFFRGYPDASDDDPGIFILDDTTKLLTSYSGGAGEHDTAQVLPLDTWFHLACTRAADGTLKLYYNGTLVQTVAMPGVENFDSMCLLNDSFVEWCDAQMGAVKVWHRVLTASQIAAESASYTAVDATGLYSACDCKTTLDDQSGLGMPLTVNGGGAAAFSADDPPIVPPVSSSVGATALTGRPSLGPSAFKVDHRPIYAGGAA